MDQRILIHIIEFLSRLFTLAVESANPVIGQAKVVFIVEVFVYLSELDNAFMIAFQQIFNS